MTDLLLLNGTYGYSNFITNNQKALLLNWVNKHIDRFNDNLNPQRKYLIIKNSDSIFNLVNLLKQKVVNLENIINYKKEPLFEDYIGINLEGGKIHLHTDPNEGNFFNVRYNIILSYPLNGGESIYGDYINKLEENLVWKCNAGEIVHGSTEVIGPKPRITLSLGFLIDKNSNPKLFTKKKLL